jgi:alkylation response protein AidB-like acyl-CoA dehydrogenase
MNFGLSDEQIGLRSALREVLSAVCPPTAVRAAWTSAAAGPTSTAVWDQLADLGLLGLLAPVELGGLGGNELDLAVLLEECGRFAAPGPLVEHLAVGVPVLVAAERAEASAAAGGQLVVTARQPHGRHVTAADVADLIVLVGDDVRVAHSAEVTVGPRAELIDHSVRAFDVDVASSVPVEAVDAGRIVDRAALAVAAELVGLASTMVTMAVDYAKVRKQFGVAIGSQQAVKHHLATALIAIEHARPVVYRAAFAMANDDPDSSRDASFAKVYAYRAADTAARAALQCHGAIGYTWEHDLHLWMKRVWALAPAWGTVVEHEDRVARAVIDVPA